MKTCHFGSRPVARVACAAIVAFLSAHAFAAASAGPVPSQQEPPAAQAALPPTEEYRPLDQQDARLAALVAESPVLTEYLRENPETTFRVGDAGSVTGFQRVDLRLNGRNVGFLMLTDGELYRGSVDGMQILPKSPPTSPEEVRLAADETPTPRPQEAGRAARQAPQERPEIPSAEPRARLAPAMQPIAAEPDMRTPAPRAMANGPTSSTFKLSEWLPVTGGLGLMWIAIVIILALTLRTTRWLSLRNLDALVLAGTCVLLATRTMGSGEPRGVQWWAYVLLTAAALYWVIRGLLLARAGSTPFHGGNVSGGGMLVLFIFAVLVAVTQVATAPISPSSRDGLVGGAYTAATGRLPYGQTPGHDEHSPLLYLLHAGAVKVVPTRATDTSGNRIALQWEHRDQWLRGAWWEGGELNAARLVNGLLLLATLAGLFMAGRALHSGTMGLTLATIFCIFPGAIECLNRPDVMLAAALLAWAVAFATFERAAGLLSLLFIVLAGLAWPWAWMGVPVLLGYFLRRGWDAAGAVAGTLAGAAGAAALLVLMTRPAIPRADGAVAAAGLHKQYVARVTDGTVVVDKVDVPATPASTESFIRRQRRAMWEWLVRDDLTLASAEQATVSLPAGVSGREIAFFEVEPTGPALQRLEAAYADLPTRALTAMGRARCALRTALEATWLPVQSDPPPGPAIWDVFASGAGAMDASQSRRWAKIAAGVLTLFTSILLLARGRQVHQALGGLLAVTAMAVLVSMSGAVANLALLLPVVLPLLAANHVDAPRMALGERMPPPPIRLGSEPRISVER